MNRMRLASGCIHPFRPSSLLRGFQFHEFASKSCAHRSQSGIGAPLGIIEPYLRQYGIVRLIQDVWAFPGRIKLTDKGV